ncbi:MAG: hypothetical protein R3C02_07820 [Planctomycetaceae bacterium]
MSQLRFGTPGLIHSSSEVLAALRAAYGNWRQIIGSQPQTAEDEKRFCDLLAASIRFTGKSVSDVHKGHQLHASLARGKELLKTALEWDEPSVGRPGSETSQLRGLQWRSVIAWSGLEQILKHVTNSTGQNDIEQLLIHLVLPEYDDLLPPDEKLSRLRRWRDKDDGDDATGINGFLQAESKATKRALRSWLISGEPVQSWPQAMTLAKVLRHVSAHGALSATKIREWGLAPVLQRLVPDMGLVGAALFERMVQECRAVYGEEVCEPVVKHNRALSFSPPDAEAILRGFKTVEVRNRRTTILGRIYVYASHGQGSDEEEAAILQQHGITDVVPARLIRGMVLGTVELHDCTPEDSCYRWHYRNPERWKRPKLPERKAQGAWFTPFKSGERK